MSEVELTNEVFKEAVDQYTDLFVSGHMDAVEFIARVARLTYMLERDDKICSIPLASERK